MRPDIEGERGSGRDARREKRPLHQRIHETCDRRHGLPAVHRRVRFHRDRGPKQPMRVTEGVVGGSGQLERLGLANEIEPELRSAAESSKQGIHIEQVADRAGYLAVVEQMRRGMEHHVRRTEDADISSVDEAGSFAEGSHGEGR